MIHRIDSIHINYKAREWCKLPYPGHPHGCPNYSRKASCPPLAPRIEDFIDISKEMYIVSREFNITEHETKMLKLHPLWSRRQCRCVLYYQPRLNSELLRETVYWARQEGLGDVYALCPEAMGVNVIATAQAVGIPILVHPKDWIYKVSVIGKKHD